MTGFGFGFIALMLLVIVPALVGMYLLNNWRENQDNSLTNQQKATAASLFAPMAVFTVAIFIYLLAVILVLS